MRVFDGIGGRASSSLNSSGRQLPISFNAPKIQHSKLLQHTGEDPHRRTPILQKSNALL